MAADQIFILGLLLVCMIVSAGWASALTEKRQHAHKRHRCLL